MSGNAKRKRTHTVGVQSSITLHGPMTEIAIHAHTPWSVQSESVVLFRRTNRQGEVHLLCSLSLRGTTRSQQNNRQTPDASAMFRLLFISPLFASVSKSELEVWW
jgi:hypothetical protein